MFSSPTLVRSPGLWISAFKERDSKTSDFSTQDGTRGPLERDFAECAVKAFSGQEHPPHSVAGGMQADIERLTAEFCALGTLYTRVPIATGDAGRAARDLVVILRPLVETAETIIRRLTAAFIRELEGSAEKYLLRRFLDPVCLHRQRGMRSGRRPSDQRLWPSTIVTGGDNRFG